MKVRLSPRAAQDLDSIATYIRAYHRAAATRVADGIEACLDLIASHPEAGRQVYRGTRRLVVPRTSYVIIYHIVSSEPAAVIVTIRHAKRRPETGLI